MARLDVDSGRDGENFGVDARFAIRSLLGRGGNGFVYAAYDTERCADVALKKLRDPSPQGIYQLKREFRSLVGLRHRNLVELHELHQTEQDCFFTMELVRGCSFVDWARPCSDPFAPGAPAVASMDSTFRDAELSAPADASAAMIHPGVLDPARLRQALVQLTRGVMALHAAGRVHRDLKPSNVLVDETGRVVILDFGLVTHRLDSKHVTATQAGIVGTPLYMAPEQVGGDVGFPSDWYSVGVMLYEALTGRPPFVGAPLQVLWQKQTGEVPDPRVSAPDAPEDLSRLCVDLLEVDPARRPSGDVILRRLGASFTADSEPPTASSHLSHSTFMPAFVGREIELRTLDSAWRSVVRGEPRIVLIEGESGMGKTALMGSFLSAVREENPDAIFLRGKCYEWELLPYKAFDGVIDLLSRYLGSMDPIDCAHLLPPGISLLRRIFPVLSRVRVVNRAPAMSNPPITNDEIRVQAFAALRQLLQGLAKRAPIVVAVDDLHWADSDSFVLLREVFSGLDAPPCLLVATARPRREPGAWIEGRRVPVQEIRLGPLSSDRMRELVQSFARSMQGVASEDFDSIVRESGGHPLFAFELVRRAAEADVPAKIVRLDDALWSRVVSLPPEARRAMTILCMAGAPLSAAVVRDAAGLRGEPGPRAIALLKAAMLARAADRSAADAIEPYHERLREAVVERLREEERTELHGALAEALDTSDEGTRRPELLVRHLRASGQDDRAAKAAVRAAAAAAHALAFDRAADLYSIALALGEHDKAAKHELLYRHAEALGDAGRGAQAAEIWLEAIEGSDDAGRIDCKRKAAAQLLVSGHIERGLAVIRDVLEEVGSSYPSGTLVGIALILWYRVRLRIRGLRWTRRDASTIAASVRARLEVFGILARSMTTVDPLAVQIFQIRELLGALRHGDHLRILTGAALLGGTTAATGGFKRARALIGLARSRAEAEGNVALLTWVRGVQGVFDYLVGDFERARNDVAAVEAIWLNHGIRLSQEMKVDLIGASAQLNQLRTIRLTALRHQGLFGELRVQKDLLERDAQRRGDRYLGAILGLGCNIVTLLDHGPDAAEAELGKAHWGATTNIHSQHWYELRSRAEIDLSRGIAQPYETHRDRFKALRRSLIARTVIWGADMDYLEARLLLAEVEAGQSGRDRKLARAARLGARLRRGKTSYSKIWGELVVAAAAAQSGNDERVVDALGRLSQLAAEHHYHLFRHLATHFLARFGGASVSEDPLVAYAAEHGVDPGSLRRIFAPGL